MWYLRNIYFHFIFITFYFFMLLLLHRTLRLRSCRNFQGFALIQAVLCKLWFLHERMYVLEPFPQTKVHHLHMVVSVFLAVLQTKHGHWVWAWGFVIYFTIFSNIEHFFLHQLVYLWVHTSRVQDHWGPGPRISIVLPKPEIVGQLSTINYLKCRFEVCIFVDKVDNPLWIANNFLKKDL